MSSAGTTEATGSRYSQRALIYQSFQKKRDGWYFGDNAPNDPRIRTVETPGSVDAKVTTADAARTMSMWGRFGRADGVGFDAAEFLRIHPQWNWQQGYLQDRPPQPWAKFEGGAKP